MDVSEPVSVQELANEMQEARQVAEKIEEFLVEGKYSPADIAILYRANSQSRNFEDALRSYAIPYKTVGSLSFYQRAEIKDILAYASLVDNSKDNLSFLRIVNLPKRQIGPAALSKIQEFADFKGWNLYETIEHLDEIVTLTKRQYNSFKAFYELIESLKEYAKHHSLEDLFKQIYVESGYAIMVQGYDSIKSKSVDDNIGELFSSLKNYQTTSPDPSLSGFLEQASLSSATEEFVNGQQVSLMTFHSAKGLEFPVVFLTGLEENVFPVASHREKRDELEEERRLCYVGMTRAQEKLIMTYAKRRTIYGQVRYNQQSTFVNELPNELINFYKEDHNGNLYKAQMTSYIRPFSKSTIFERGAQSKEKNSQDQDESDRFIKEDRVYHDEYGNGTIMQVFEEKNMAKVAFRGTGIKTIGTAFLKKVNE